MTTSAAMLLPLLYLISVLLFITGLKRLCFVRTARTGNAMAAAAMLLAVAGTLLEVEGLDYRLVFSGLVIGSVIGAGFAVYVQMTQMPQMVALFNGFGGGASALVALSSAWPVLASRGAAGPLVTSEGPAVATTIVLSLMIGAFTFSGSLVAFLKLQDWIDSRPTLLPGRHAVNGLVLAVTLAAGVWFAYLAHGTGLEQTLCLGLLFMSLLVGVLVVLPIGGADMPVVIALLNSCSGLAASATGFILDNPLLVIGGSLVGASGLYLTKIMCHAMNRSIVNVCLGGFGSVEIEGSGRPGGEYRNVRSCSAEEASLVLEHAASAVIVPGYGLAVAQAQHLCRELGDQLEKRGTRVSYAIHPVAGRMPGHMNVLLAEADVSYDQLVEMDEINPEFENVDVVLVVGANDVVNPAALKDSSSPIYGMPILEVDGAQTVFVIKRSLSPGFAGIKNELFEYPNTMMLFGDAKEILRQLVQELKQVSEAA